ncbi:MAG: endonuclease/exonuclease/phosphatase family protein [Myxococcota bacterium]
MLSGITWLGSGAFLFLAVVHGLAGDSSVPLVVLHAATAWVPLGVVPFLGLALARRKGREAVPGVLTLVLWAVYNRPPLPTAALPEGIELRVVSANALMVNPTPDALVREVLAAQPDVLVFQELTPELQAEMAGVPGLVHRREHPEHHSFGVGLYSRYPIRSEWLVNIAGVDWQRAVLDVDGTDVEVWNVHTLPPFRAENHVAWQSQVAVLSDRAAKHEGPLVLAGDLNLTRHHASYGLLTASLVDAFRDCGRWVAATWPANGYFVPGAPKIRLDHVLLGGGVRCAAIAIGEGPGSDHRPVIADLVVPRAPAGSVRTGP